MLLLLLSLTLLSEPLRLVHGLAIAGSLLLLLSVHLALARSRSSSRERDAPVAEAGLGDRMTRRLEQLKDAHWELSENEVRLRAVLDAQRDLIARFDCEGRLTFVNSAFARAFGLDGRAALGALFMPEVLACEPGGASGRTVELVKTASGPRWMAWEKQRVPGRGTAEDVQWVGRDVTEAREADLALKEARNQAEDASRAKSRFLAAVSHEIRTPMNGILGMAGLLSDTPLSPDQETYVHAIDQSARNLLGLIAEVLDFSKIEAGKLVLASEPFSLAGTVQGVVELLAPSAEEKGLEIVWEIEPLCTGMFLGDEARVRQILLNLVSNAVKFTDHGGVTVRVERVPAGGAKHGADRVRVAVIDTGIGLSKEDQSRLFAEFEQTDAAVRRQRGGTGLGLAISMRLACAMGGTISVESAPGRGSTFAADLALASCEKGELKPQPALEPEAAARLHVLLAGRRLLERGSLARVLSGFGIRTSESVLDGAPACLEAAAATGCPVNCVVVEGDCSASEAAQVLSLARELAGDGEPVRGVVLISVLSRAGLSEFRAAGYDGYLVRPVRPQSLLAQLVERGSPSGGSGQKRGERSDDSLSRPLVRDPWPGRRPRVLLAEDNAINALLATRLLEKAGCDVVLAKDGNEAVAAVRLAATGSGQAFDIVLMDIHMPALDGIGATHAIKAMLETDGASGTCPPIVALTANALAEDREHYLEAGMCDSLAKPFDAVALGRLLDRWMPATGVPTEVPSTAA